MRSAYKLIPLMAVLTTLPRHLIGALQAERVLIAGDVWHAVVAAFAFAFACLEGLTIMQVEQAREGAGSEDVRRLARCQRMLWLAVGATFVLPLGAQMAGRQMSEFVGSSSPVFWLQSVLFVIAPVIVLWASATANSVMAGTERGRRDDDHAAKEAELERMLEQARAFQRAQEERAAREIALLNRQLEQAQEQAREQARLIAPPVPERPAQQGAQRQDGAQNGLERLVRDTLAAYPDANSAFVAAAIDRSASAVRKTRAWQERGREQG